MGKYSETERLTRYQEAMSELPPETQLNKMAAVKSPQTLRRFLSEQAPENLIARFAHRYREVANLDLTDYERGVALLEFAAVDESIKHFKAAEPTDVRATIKLAMIQLMDFNGKRQRGEKIPESVVAQNVSKVAQLMLKGYGSSDAHQMLADFFAARGEKEKSYHHRQEAIDKSTNAAEKEYLQSIHLPHGNVEAAREATELVFSSAQKGFRYAIRHIENAMRELGHRDEVQKNIELSIRHGDVRRYYDLAIHYVEEGNMEGVIECGRKGIKMKNQYVFNHIASLLLEHDTESAKKFYGEMIAAGLEEGYRYMGILLVNRKDGGENEEFWNEYDEKKTGKMDLDYLYILLRRGKFREVETECNMLLQNKETAKKAHIYAWLANFFIHGPTMTSLKVMLIAMGKNGMTAEMKKITKTMARGKHAKGEKMINENAEKLLAIVGINGLQGLVPFMREDG